MDTQGFSFPKISDNHAYGTDSPPLWNLSPAGSTSPYRGLRDGKKGDEKVCFEAKVVSKDQRKSFSSVQNGKKKKGVDGEDDSMDFLWEGFNEELTSPRGSATSSSRELVEFRCATALTVAKTGGAFVQTKNRSGMVVIVKALKKLFYFNTSQRKTRKRVL